MWRCFCLSGSAREVFSNILACPVMAQPCVVIAKRNRDPDEMEELHEKIGMVL